MNEAEIMSRNPIPIMQPGEEVFWSSEGEPTEEQKAELRQKFDEGPPGTFMMMEGAHDDTDPS